MANNIMGNIGKYMGTHTPQRYCAVTNTTKNCTILTTGTHAIHTYQRNTHTPTTTVYNMVHNSNKSTVWHKSNY